MVSTPTTVDTPTMAQIQTHLRSNTRGWLTTTGPHLSVSYSALAALIYDLITTHTTHLHQRCAAAESDTAQLRGQRSALWHLLKDRTRAVILLNQQNTELHFEWWDLRTAVVGALGHTDDHAAHLTDTQLITELAELGRATRQRHSEGGGVGG